MGTTSSCKVLKVTSFSPLSYRKSIANAAKADYFISLHCDGIENLSGNFAVMCYFDDNGKNLADKIAKNYSQVKGNIAKRSDLTVLGNGGANNAKYKVLIEFGFITTPRIARNLVKNSKSIKLTKITKHAKRHFWLNDICTCHGLLPSHSA